jgi:mono/diheme cytochrome c family protein
MASGSMWATNLKIALTVVVTLALYTMVANMIPQVQSEVPQELDLGAEVTPDQLIAAGEQVYRGAGGCTACHGLGTRAPDLLGVVGTTCAERVPGKSCKDYLHESMVDPTAYVVEGFQPIMPDMSRTLPDDQIWATIAFLQSQGGEVTVTADDFAGSESGQADEGAMAGAPGQGDAADGSVHTDDPIGLLRANQCLACHQLAGEGGPIAPAFDDIGARRDAAFIRKSILYPNADTAQGYEQLAGTMPATFGDQLSAAELEAIVEFLAEQR